MLTLPKNNLMYLITEFHRESTEIDVLSDNAPTKLSIYYFYLLRDQYGRIPIIQVINCHT